MVVLHEDLRKNQRSLVEVLSSRILAEAQEVVVLKVTVHRLHLLLDDQLVHV